MTGQWYAEKTILKGCPRWTLWYAPTLAIYKLGHKELMAYCRYYKNINVTFRYW